ncbi:MAG: hypothetical protein HN348_23980 [Proteobacteria bacterium]|jgi:hypothetical protein|nr:hypothetical protein [Pseudomonadota bacterium]
MARRRQNLNSTSWWPSLPAIALAMTVFVSFDADRMTSGGLAPLAIAAVVALFIGVPLANIERRTQSFATMKWSPTATGLAELLTLMLIASLMAPLMTSTVAIFACWLLAWVFGRWFPVPTIFIMVLVTALCVLGVLALSVQTAAPWTLVEPHWEGTLDWLPWALTAGLLLAAAGLGHWAEGPSLVPGSRRAPWAVAGTALGVVLATTYRHGVTWESLIDTDLWGIILSVLGLFTAAVAIIGRGPSKSRRDHRALLGLALTLWFFGPGEPAANLFWPTLLPLGMAAIIAFVGLANRGVSRWFCALATVMALTAALVGWPGLPNRPADAAIVALTIVAAVWLVGTQQALARSQ